MASDWLSMWRNYQFFHNGQQAKRKKEIQHFSITQLRAPLDFLLQSLFKLLAGKRIFFCVVSFSSRIDRALFQRH